MTRVPETPFESIEGAQEYLNLLVEALHEARSAIEHDASIAATTKGAERRLEALRVVNYKLSQLHEHLTSSHRILNDLRTLRRLLLRERHDVRNEAASPGPQQALRGPAGS